MISSFNYCFYWFSGTICIPDSIFMLTYKSRFPFISLYNQPGNIFPGFTQFFIPNLLESSPLAPHCPAIVFLLHFTRFLSQRNTEYPQKGGAEVQAVKSSWFFANLISDMIKNSVGPNLA